MKPETEHQTVVIDMSSEEAASSSGGRLPLIIALLSMLVVAGLGGLGYLYWQNMQQDMQQMLHRIQLTSELTQQLKQSVDQTQGILQTQKKLLEKQNAATSPELNSLLEQQQAFRQQADLLTAERNLMQQREVELRATIADLRKRLGNPDQQWMVAEAEYLLKLAQQRLMLAKDHKTALAALQQADQRLQDSGDPQWGLVREQLARDIAMLEELKVTDVQVLLARLDNLNVLFAKLHPRLIAVDSGSEMRATEPFSIALEQSEGVEGLAQDLWQGLRNSVKIRRYDQPAESLLTHGQEMLILQNLGLIAETARLAVMQKKPLLYQDSLRRMQQWLARYYVLDDDIGAQAVAEVKALWGIDIAPVLPELSLALKALQSKQQLNASGAAQ